MSCNHFNICRDTKLEIEDKVTGAKSTKSVHQYYLDEYKGNGWKWKHPDLPLLWVGSPNRQIYWPLELCEVVKQPAPKDKSLNDDQTARMIKETAMLPQKRKQMIEDNLRAIWGNQQGRKKAHGHEYAK